MFCRRCYASLEAAADQKCPACGLPFDPNRRRTFLARPFPAAGKIAFHVTVTTFIAILAAMVVAFHQAARTSGH